MKFVPKKLEQTADISRGKSTWRDHVKNAVSVLLVLLAAYVLILGAAKLAARFISDETEARWFAWEMLPSEKPEPPQFRRADELFQQMIETPGLRRLPYALSVIAGDEPNAGALPGGRVVVTEGLLKQVENDAGLALVLGHELGHHQYRHCLEQLGHGLLLQAFATLVFGQSDPTAVVSGYALLQRAHSREQERDADAFGMKMVKRTLGDTQGALAFFELVKREYDREPSTWVSWMSTHPLTEERIRDLRRLQRTVDTKTNGQQDPGE